jgi:hypothetical protein
MKERFIIGVVAGTIAGILKDIPDAIFHFLLRITNITFSDYAGTIALGHRPAGLTEHLYAVFYEIVFSVFIGIIFVNLAPYFETKHYLLRGAIYGALVWFTIRCAVMAFGITPLVDGDILSTIINSLNSILYGTILGVIIHYLERKRFNNE